MGQTWTFGRKLGVGLIAKLFLTLLMAVVAIWALQYVIAAKDEVITKNARIVTEAQNLQSIALERPGAVRAFLLTKDPSLLENIRQLRQDAIAQLGKINALASTSQERQAVEQLKLDVITQFDAGDKIVEMRKNQEDMTVVGKAFEDQVVPLFNTLREHLMVFVELEERNLEAAKEHASEVASTAIIVVIVFAAASVVFAGFLAFFLTRSLTRQIGSAVQHIQSSSSELQAAANQQTAGSKEQVASMTEISATIKELMATAKQIADSAQGVARIADSASSSARGGDQTVGRAQAEVATIRKQVDVVVEHMLDLGKKSQQIGGILEIINELAEQTNILSINATIEAAGAGESGKRFAVVADEIRKLADRVGGSTKEIRGLIDQIRSAVNAAVLATEGGSKAVDAGSRQFAEVTAVFRQISGLAGNTNEAAKEIELSTKQQSTAVEQVNVAVANVAQAAREAEASSAQVLQTVAELTALSRDLGRLVQPRNSN